MNRMNVKPIRIGADIDLFDIIFFSSSLWLTLDRGRCIFAIENTGPLGVPLANPHAHAAKVDLHIVWTMDSGHTLIYNVYRCVADVSSVLI